MAEDDVFRTYDITPEFANSMKSIFKPPYSQVGKDAICCPRINPILCEDVIYTDDPFLLAQDAIEVTESHTLLSSTNAGRYKRKVWEFQKECRFKFLVYPMPEQDVKLIMNVGNLGLEKSMGISVIGMNNIFKKLPISQEYYNAALSDTALDNLQVMLGPRTTVAQETIVRALLKQYAPKAVVRRSELKLRE